MTRGLRLKTQLLLIVAFVELYTIGMGLAYWVQAQAQERLEHSFRQDLVTLTKLPQLRDTLRSLDDMTDRYLLEGGSLWLERRQAGLADVRATVGELSAILKERGEERPLLDLEQRIASYVAEQEHWISLKQSRRLSPADASRLARLDTPFREIAAKATDLKDVSVGNLNQRRAAVHKASQLALVFVLLTGLLSSVLLGVFLSRFMITPVLELEERARTWQLGQTWDFDAESRGAEFASLFSRMREMAERLNQQYGRERELGELKTQLVSMVSHEFNNAMTVIVGVTALLEDSEGESQDRRARYYEMIKDSVRTLTMACSNLLNMGRLESGRFALNTRRIEVRTVLQDTARRLEVLSLQKNLTVSLEFPEQPVPVRADPDALSLVITNLLSNAIKYTPEGGKVALGLHRPGEDMGRVEVFCRDSGIGISPEDKERILAGYYRTESGKRAAKGFGVGLTLANSLVEAHGSALSIQSEPGKGSTFSFRLAVWTEEPSPSGTPVGPKAQIA